MIATLCAIAITFNPIQDANAERAGWRRFSSEKHDFAVTIPPGWEDLKSFMPDMNEGLRRMQKSNPNQWSIIKQAKESDDFALFIVDLNQESIDSGFPNTLNIVHKRTRDPIKVDDAYLEQLRQGFGKNVGGVTRMEIKRVNLPGALAAMVETENVTNVNTGEKVTRWTYYVPYQKRLMVVTAICKLDQTAKVRPVVEQTMRTFRFGSDGRVSQAAGSGSF